MTDARCALLVVGGGPAGHAAATAFRDAGGRGRVLLVSGDSAPPYNRPPLSKDFLRGETESESLPLGDESFYADRDIDVSLRTRVIHLDPVRRRARLSDGRVVEFDLAVLATGAAPSALDVPGFDPAIVKQLRSLDDAQKLRQHASTDRTALVLGSGFIGCEAAYSLAVRGLEVVQVSQEERPQIKRLGRSAAERIAGWLTDAGIVLRGSAEISGMSGTTVTMADGTELSADLVLSAVGMDPQSGLAADAGLAMHKSRIVVDDHMRASSPGIFAAGDVVFAHNGLAGRHLTVEHWGEAERMGEVAGRVAAGQPDAWAQVPGFWSEIGPHTLKYAAWGDGYDEERFVSSGDGFTVWYAKDSRLVGVLTHEADDDYERAQELVSEGAPLADRSSD